MSGVTWPTMKLFIQSVFICISVVSYFVIIIHFLICSDKHRSGCNARDCGREEEGLVEGIVCLPGEGKAAGISVKRTC